MSENIKTTIDLRSAIEHKLSEEKNNGCLIVLYMCFQRELMTLDEAADRANMDSSDFISHMKEIEKDNYKIDTVRAFRQMSCEERVDGALLQIGVLLRDEILKPTVAAELFMDIAAIFENESNRE